MTLGQLLLQSTIFEIEAVSIVDKLIFNTMSNGIAANKTNQK